MSDARVRPRPIRDLAAAIGFLTLLPFGRTWAEDDVPRSTGWYPWVGWLLGAAVMVPLYGAIRVVGHQPQSEAVLTGALIVGAWAVLTRFLHWDGLADTFDGIWGGSTPERRLEIMRDSHVGSFGVAAMLLVALVQVGAISAFVSERVLWPLAAAPVLGRLAAATAAWSMPAARSDGLGLAVTGTDRTYERVVGAAALLAVLVFVPLGAPTRELLMVCAAGVFAALVVPGALAKRVGGMTGDLFGATVLIVETVVLVAAAVVT